jgi:hypothetical protein
MENYSEITEAIGVTLGLIAFIIVMPVFIGFGLKTIKTFFKIGVKIGSVFDKNQH